MSVAFADLVARLEDDVPARDSVPSSSQYEFATRDAVADYSRRVPMQRTATISVVSGTASYSLPSDFVRLVKLDLSTDGVIQSGGMLVPQPVTFTEQYTIAGLTITFIPTPTYTLDRTLWYTAAHVLASGSYADLTDADAAVLILLAQSKALMHQATKTAHDAWQYAMGDERVNKEKLSAALKGQADGLKAEYAMGVEAMGGQGKGWAVRATYTLAEQGTF